MMNVVKILSSNKAMKAIVVLLTSLLIISCGGGGGGGTTPSPITAPPPTLTVSPTMITVDENAASESVSITTTASWTATNNANWVTLSTTSGSGNGTLTLTIAANDTSDSRTTEVTITAGTLNKTVSISQSAAVPVISYAIPPDSTGMRDINSTDFTDLMGLGFNIGNSLDAVGGETTWGNPVITKALVDAIKAAGFKSIRLPVAWSQFSDADNFIIKSEWLTRVEEVVNYALANDMYVVMNIHWDGGWMQPTNADKDYVNNRLAIMWQQIATHFRDYDDHLLFAGTNEVMVTNNYNTPTAEYYTVQNSFNQTFVTTVRKTGGRNAYRQLVVQGFNTNIDHAVNFATIPEDSIANRLMMEVHYYDPYNFTLEKANDNTSQWGENAVDSSKTAGWGDESAVDAQFLKMREHFYDKNVGVILGEYGAISRTNIAEHEQYRIYWNEYITQAAIDNKMVPFYWDNGDTSNHGLGLFNRATAEEVYPDLINAITKAAP